MKKYLLLLASAALLLVGCAKEQLSKGPDGGMTSITFSASVDGGVATKAFADDDGNGAFVNRCIMEIYFQDQLYKRMEAAMSGTPATATFANVPVVAGKQYQILFWADHVDNNDTADSLATDKYYNTQSLKAVQIIKESFIDALSDDSAQTNDYLDAFFGADDYTVGQTTNNSFNITLHRPFAQLNVITTDVAAGKTVTSATLLPERDSVRYEAANTINVATGEISGTETYKYKAPVYGDTGTWSNVKDRGELTLSMDYILAPTEQGAIDVTFKTLNGESTVMTHNLTNLPYKRNYRTNVKGELLTVGGSWTATIAPAWGDGEDSGEIDHIIASSYTDVVNALQSGNDSKNMKVTVTPAAVNNLSDAEKSQVIVNETIGEEQVQALKFVLYEEKTTGPDAHPASPDHVEFELPARPTGVKAWKIEHETNYPTQTVVVSTPPEDTDPTIIIEAPKSTVTLDATKINSVVSTTSENTLIIPQGLELKNLIVKKGAVEYHGTGLLKVKVEATGTDKVYFKTSEGLANTDDVYGVVKDHIAEGFAITKESESTWKIVPEVCKIGTVGYGSVADAFVAVESGQTIVMLQNDVLTKGQTIALENNEAFTLDLNGKTISIAETGFDFTANGTNNALRSGVPVRFAIVVNGNGTMTICDNSADKLGRLETKNNSYGTTKTILVDGNAIVNVNSGTIAADYAPFYVVGYMETGAAPANAPKPTLNVNGGNVTGQNYSIVLKGNTSTLTVCGGNINANGEAAISTNGTQDWYDGGNCKISISGGTIKSFAGSAMYLPAEAETIITGGFFEGLEGITVKGGLLSISGDAVVKANGAYGEAGAESSGASSTGSAIYVEDTYSNHAPFVNISGGKFSSVNNKVVEYYTTKADDAADKGKVTLTGGIYSDAPDAALVAAGYAVLDNQDASTKAQYPKTVKVKPVVKIGNVEYADIADAFADVPTDGTPTTVTLLENIGSKEGNEITWKEYNRTFAYTVNANQNITFDLNGKKIYAKTTVTGYTGFLLVKNGGSLTIKDSVGGGELNYLDGKDNEGGLAISSEGTLVMESGTVENHTKCNNSAIQGAIDVHANEWGTPYAHHVTFTMNGGVLKSNGDNTLRIYDSSQTGTGGVVIDFEINGGEIYGADAVFIMPAWIKGPTHVSNDTHMNNINVSVKGGIFDTNNGIRVYQTTEQNTKDYMAIKISVTGGNFTIRNNNKYRVNHVAFQSGESTESATVGIRSFTEVTWTAAAPIYCQE